MTLVDRIFALLLERGPLSACVIAVELRRRKEDVLAALRDHRFQRMGKGRSTLWDVREPGNGVASFTAAELATLKASWTCRPDDPGCSLEEAERFLVDFERLGVVARVNGNGAFRLTEWGLELGAVLDAAVRA